jgi:Spy/CpxP family protein refolding chaperone
MNHKQTNLIAVLALGGMMVFTAIATAQEAKPASPPAEKKAAAPVPTEADIAKLEADLSLSPELTAKIEALQKDQNAHRKEMFKDASLSEADKEAKNKAIVAETRENIKALLTPEQYAKWQKLHEARKAFKAANKK